MDVVAHGSPLAVNGDLLPSEHRIDGLGDESLALARALGLSVGVGGADNEGGKAGIAVKHHRVKLGGELADAVGADGRGRCALAEGR